MGERGKAGGMVRLWTSSAPCPAPAWISAGSGPVLLGAALGGLAGDSRDRQKQNGSKPAVCTELLLAQGLYLIPSTPAL